MVVVSVDGAVRVSDAERGQVADRLATAHAEGRLTLAEYDERVRVAHGAVVRDDLAPLTRDLPGRPEVTSTAVVGTSRPEPRPYRGSCGFAGPFPVPPGLPVPAGGLRGAVAAWAVVGTVNVLVWLAVVIGSGAGVYPWWVWVAGPWGVALLLRALGRSAASRSQRRHPRAHSGSEGAARSPRDPATWAPSGSRRRGGWSRR